LSTDNYIGTCLDGRFQILSLIGEGGTSYLYLAQHLLLDKQVAVKVLKHGAYDQYLQRFLNEAKTATLLDHPNIARVDSFGVTEKGPFIVMDYIDGQPLSKMLETDGRLSPSAAVRLFGKVADALSHAHKQGVVHRDLKPSNIMLTKSGEPKIVDFGIAKLIDPGEISASQHLTQTGQLLGTPAYMSPEQVSGKKTDARTDIYSLGCVMYEALTGKRPFEGNTPLETMYKHLNDPIPAAPQLPPDLQQLLNLSMQKNPEDRQANMEQLAAELAACRDLEKTFAVRSKDIPKSAILAVVSLVVALPIIAFAFFPKPTSVEEPSPSRPVAIPKKLINSVSDVVAEGSKLMNTDINAAVKKFELSVQMSEQGMPYDDEPRSMLYTRVGRIHLHFLNNISEAEKWFNKGLKQSDQFEDKQTGYRGSILQDFGDLYCRKFLVSTNQKDFDKSLAYYEKARQIYVAINQPESTGWVMGKIGNLYASNKDWKKAEERMAQCAKLVKESTDVPGYWVGAANYQGGTFEAQGKWAQALDVYRKTVEWAQIHRPPDPRMVTTQQINVARTLVNMNRLDEARQVYRQALKSIVEDKEYDRLTIEGVEYAKLLKALGKNEEAKFMRKLAKNPAMPVSEIP
jgi:serine/threonine protein kinase